MTEPMEDALFLRHGGDPADLSLLHTHDSLCIVTEPITITTTDEAAPIRAWQDQRMRCALDFTCPTCRAEAPSPCRNTSTYAECNPHKRRRTLARVAPW